MTACEICGSRTGLHGFSWEKNDSLNMRSGILLIPEALTKEEWDNEAKFVDMVLESLREILNERDVIPEIRIVKNEQ